jgi:hypothetical protein
MKIYKNILAVALIAAFMGVISCGPNAEEKAKEKAKADQDQKKTDNSVDSLAATMGGGDNNNAKVGPADTSKKKDSDKKDKKK